MVDAPDGLDAAGLALAVRRHQVAQRVEAEGDVLQAGGARDLVGDTRKRGDRDAVVFVVAIEEFSRVAFGLSLVISTIAPFSRRGTH